MLCPFAWLVASAGDRLNSTVARSRIAISGFFNLNCEGGYRKFSFGTSALLWAGSCSPDTRIFFRGGSPEPFCSGIAAGRFFSSGGLKGFILVAQHKRQGAGAWSRDTRASQKRVYRHVT